jgi:acetyl esterase/lipase
MDVAAGNELPGADMTKPQEYEVDELRDIPYYQGAGADSVRHTLDLFKPRGRTAYPVLILVHGGAWVDGDKNFGGQYSAVGQALARQGIGTVMPNYRLSPAVKHPEHVKDVVRALAWTVKNIAGHGGQPGSLFLAGHSAGGHLVSLLTTNPVYLKAENLAPEIIRGVISVSGVYRIPEVRVRLNLDFLGKDLEPLDLSFFPFSMVFGTEPDAGKQASPLTHVRSGLPPFLLLNAEDDLLTLPRTAREFAAALTRAGNQARHLEIKQRDHESILFDARSGDDPVIQAIRDFVAENEPRK